MASAALLPYSLTLASPGQTSELARTMATVLGTGDVVALEGAIGTGKSTFARAAIRARLQEHGADEEVPSPTYTLVQTYQAGPLEIWHCDLYRLGDPSEAAELGLAEAYETALCLIEWPERLRGGPDTVPGTALPARALHLHLAHGAAADQRRLTISGDAGHWAPRLAAPLQAFAAVHCHA